ncbi:MAG: hypothetical protein IPM56_13845 [Ignavibacteriales bacterium]|nr:MAG: hypothetical protein IPM56_13845 [Ignavibacteriales bacterium]
MTIKQIDGEIIVDLTLRNNVKLKNPSIADGLILLDTSYKIELNKTFPKYKTRISNHAVDVYYLYCTCKTYRESIKKYPKRDIRRICKHLFLAISSKFIDRYDELTKLLIESKFWYSHNEIFKLSLNNEIIYIAFSFEKELANLFLKRNEWQLFPFDINTKDWKKDVSSSLAETEIKLIKNFILRFYKDWKNEQNPTI